MDFVRDPIRFVRVAQRQRQQAPKFAGFRSAIIAEEKLPLRVQSFEVPFPGEPLQLSELAGIDAVPIGNSASGELVFFFDSNSATIAE